MNGFAAHGGCSWRRAVVAALIGALIAISCRSASIAQEQSTPAMECNGFGNISLDDRIAGCSALIEAASTAQQIVTVSLFRRALFYRQKGELDLAIADYDQIIDHDPKNLSAYLGRSSAYRGKDELDRAIADCGRVIEISPNGDFGYLCRGEAYRDRNDLDRALADFERAVQLNPKDPRAHSDVASVHQRRDNAELALSSLDEALQLDPNNAGLYFSRGVVRLGVNMLPGAIEDFNRSSEINPKSLYTRLWLEIARKRSGEPGRLADSVGQLNMEKWPAPLIHLFLGDETLETVLAAVGKKKGLVCEANFYAGELALIQDSMEDAIRLLHLAADGCPRMFVEWSAANAELRRLNSKP